MEGFLDLNMWQKVMAATGFLLLYITIVVIHRLTLHPLAKYPGPFFGKVTGWFRVFQAASGADHLETRKLHEIYGPIVRIGPNTVCINTVKGLHAIYGARNANVQKSDWYRTVGAAAQGFSAHSEVDRQKHGFRRRIMEHAFSENALRSAEEFVHNNVDIFCQRLGEACKKTGDWSAVQNMSDWCTYLGYDIMGDLTFGERFNCIDNEEHRYVPGAMMETTKFIYTVGQFPCISLIRPLLGTPLMNLLGGEMSRTAQKYIEYASTQMARRVAAEHDKSSEKQDRKDISHFIINAKDPETGKGLLTSEIYADSSLLISAGSDTTAVAMSAMLFYLLHNPNVLKKLVAEIRSAYSSASEINGATRVAYLRACIDEALRLSPPAGGILPREVLPGGLNVDGHYFPPGTVVGTSAYAIHHNPEYYPEPFRYYPERWIVDNDENAEEFRSVKGVAVARSAFCAFSLGRRGCIGKNLAYRELEVIMGKLLYMFDIALPENSVDEYPSGEGGPHHEHPERQREDEYQLVEHFLSSRNGPSVQFRAAAAAMEC